MRKLHKKYILLSIVLSSFLFGGSLFIVFVIDPAGVFNKFNIGLIKNEGLYNRTQKFAEIQNFQPNTIILGGSRVHFLNTKDIKKYTKDKVYNLSFARSTLQEQYYFLKYSLEHFNIKNVVMGLNLYPFSDKINKGNTDFNKDIFNNGLTLTRKVNYLLEVPLSQYFKENYIKKYNKPLYKDGSRTAYLQEKIIDNKPWDERAKGSLRGYKDTYTDYLEFSKKNNLEYFKKSVALCKKYKVNLKVFTTAIYVSQLELLKEVDKMDIYYQWKRDIAKITPYWDFMYPNSITTNSANYIDTSHIKQENGKYYFARIWNDKSVKVPNDFGVYVNSVNIDKHTGFLKDTIK